MTQNCIWWRSYSSRECEIPFHRHYSKIYPEPRWMPLSKFHPRNLFKYYSYSIEPWTKTKQTKNQLHKTSAYNECKFLTMRHKITQSIMIIFFFFLFDRLIYDAWLFELFLFIVLILGVIFTTFRPLNPLPFFRLFLL